MTHAYKHYFVVIAVEIILWHMQGNLAPHKWWKLGKSLEEYMLCCMSLDILGTGLKGTLSRVCYDECQIWVHIECDLTCNSVEVISLLLYDDILMSLLLDIYMQLFNKYLLLTWHCGIGFGKDRLLLSYFYCHRICHYSIILLSYFAQLYLQKNRTLFNVLCE